MFGGLFFTFSRAYVIYPMPQRCLNSLDSGYAKVSGPCDP